MNNIFNRIINLFSKSSLPKYVLDIGHSESRQGVINSELGISEYRFNYQLATRILEIYMQGSYANKNISYKLYDLFNLEILTRGNLKDSYLTEPSKINSLKPKAVISLHCNSYNRLMTGTETNYLDGDEVGRKFANILHGELFQALKLTSLGINPIDLESENGWFISNIKSPTVITKPFFIDNIIDTRKAIVSIDSIARAYIKGILTMEELGGGILVL